MRGQDGSDKEYSGSEDDDRLAGLWQSVEEDDSDDAELTESAKKQLQHAAVLRKRSVSILHLQHFPWLSVLCLGPSV